MMTNEAKKWLFDVREACVAIESFVAGKSLTDYRASELVRSATERKFEIIGEAMSKLRDREPEVFAETAEGHAIIGFRNRLIHGYDTVDNAIVWDVVSNKLPTLRADVERLLAQ